MIYLATYYLIGVILSFCYLANDYSEGIKPTYNTIIGCFTFYAVTFPIACALYLIFCSWDYIFRGFKKMSK